MRVLLQEGGLVGQLVVPSGQDLEDELDGYLSGDKPLVFMVSILLEFKHTILEPFEIV